MSQPQCLCLTLGIVVWGLGIFLATGVGCASPMEKTAWQLPHAKNQDAPEPPHTYRGQTTLHLSKPQEPAIDATNTHPAIHDADAVATTPLTLHFQWPIETLGITSLFGERLDPLNGKRRFHGGLDLEAPYGALVFASADGKVVAVGFRGGYGRQVILQHAGSFVSTYAHLSQTLVFVGQDIKAGQAIGRLGNSGRTTGPHLHFEISKEGKLQDPLLLLEETLPLQDGF